MAKEGDERAGEVRTSGRRNWPRVTKSRPLAGLRSTSLENGWSCRDESARSLTSAQIWHAHAPHRVRVASGSSSAALRHHPLSSHPPSLARVRVPAGASHAQLDRVGAARRARSAGTAALLESRGEPSYEGPGPACSDRELAWTMLKNCARWTHRTMPNAIAPAEASKHSEGTVASVAVCAPVSRD